MKKYKKLLFLASMLWLCASGYAQRAKEDPSLNLKFDVVEVNPDGNGNCLTHVGGTKTYTVNHNSPYFYKFTFRAIGDIKIDYNSGDTVVISAINATSFGKGRLIINASYRLPDDLPCVSTECWEKEGTVGTDVDIFQKFTIDDLPLHHQQIAGAKCLKPNEEYPYSVEAILTKGFNHNIGIDIYKWELPQSGSVYEDYRSEDNSSITLKLYTGREIGPTDTLKVWFGQCNFNSKPLTKVLRPSSELPEVEHDSLDCIQTDTVHFKVINGRADHWYKFTSTAHGFNVKPVWTKLDNVYVFTNGFSGKVTLYASNNFDTVSKDFYISRRTYLSCVIQGDSACLQPNSVAEFKLYPSPNVGVTWKLPAGWQGDEANPKSSTVYFVLDSNAVSGTIIASSAECPTTFDSMFVSVDVNNYVPEGIISDNGKCFAEGDTVTFRFKKDPNSLFYEWTFPSTDWQPISPDCTTENGTTYTVANDTVIKVIVGGFGKAPKIKLTSTSFCGDGEKAWTMEFDSIYEKPSNVIIDRNDDKFCVNKGIVDTINFAATAQNPSSVTHYQWLYPDSWNLLNTSRNNVTLQTDGMGDSTEIFVIGMNDQCGRSADTAKITVVFNGSDVAISLAYTEIPPPLPILPKRVIISATVTPEGSYYYQWHSTGSSNIVEYGIDRYEYANPNIDTNNYNYGVEVMNLSTNGCSTIQWLKNNPVNLSTGYTDTVVEIAPPAVTPPALSSPSTKTAKKKQKSQPRQAYKKMRPK